MISGREYIVGGEKLIVPGITIFQLREHKSKAKKYQNELKNLESEKDNSLVEEFKEKVEEYVLDLKLSLVLKAINRNYPEYSKEKLEEKINAVTLNEIFDYCITGDLEQEDSKEEEKKA